MMNALADKYGALKMRQSELDKEEKALREQLLATGDVRFEGSFFDVVVSPCEPRATLSMEAAKLFLKPALLAKITKMSAPGVRWRVLAKASSKAA